MTQKKHRGERGSIMVELVVAVPLLVLVACIVIQGLVLASGVSAIGVAAKEAARAAASASCVSANPTAVAKRVVPEFVTIKRVDTVNEGSGIYRADVTATLKWKIGSVSAPDIEVKQSARMPRITSCP